MPLRYALVGCGNIGTSAHLPAAARVPELQLAAVCDVAAERAQLAAQKHGVPAYTEVEALLEKERPEVVDVCTPEAEHRQVVIQALQAGADVICEKQLADTIGDAEAMLATGERTGRRLAVNYNYRYLAGFLKLKELLDGGYLGFVRTISSSFHWHQGTHSLDMMRHLGGEVVELCGAETVDEGQAETEGERRPARVRNACACFRYLNGALGAANFTSWPVPWHGGNMNFEVVGTKRRAQVVGAMGELVVYSHQPAEGPERPELVAARDWVSSFERSLAAFATAITQDRPHPVSGLDGLRAMQLDEGIRRSQAQRSWVKPY